MGLVSLLAVTAIVTTVVFVLLAEAPNWAKATAIGVCIASFLIPKVIHSLWFVGGPLQAALSVVLIICLRYQRLLR